MFYTIKENQWYGYDAYDGAYHYFIRAGIPSNGVWLFIDSFADVPRCSGTKETRLERCFYLGLKNHSGSRRKL